VVYRGTVKLTEGHGVVDHPSPSNNVAEYMACVKALTWLIESGLTDEPVEIRSDSRLLIYQLLGHYRVSAPRIVPLFKRVKGLTKNFGKIRFKWVPREENEEADSLSRKAYEDYVDSHSDFYGRYGRYLATEKQKRLLAKLKVDFKPHVSKREASKLIQKALKRQVR
jgi:ribonuclease HI